MNADNKKSMNKDQGKGAYSSDETGNNNYPGYPHYPENEDITRPGNNEGKQLLNEENITLPNANDIPGQEHITPAPLGELADTTASSADEEDIVHGDSLDDRDDDVRIVPGTNADVTREDLRMLEAADQNMDTIDDVNLETGSLDSVDDDGDPLNEEDSINEDMSGKDLDVPGSEADDADENIGEEDEENNYYSLGGDNHEGQEEDNYDS